MLHRFFRLLIALALVAFMFAAPIFGAYMITGALGFAFFILAMPVVPWLIIRSIT